ncbi:hypothetical protein CKM354_000438500 [Cercospora kikuchii]|uniref:Protein kinase domain-containing protein n=1 Tax=Cercospora kikuchii TaxID=84275 RepID=A0A9P3FFQ4_9PEZI|nr:uncharacterized protein CKM354_000438500 [Cercospora kikuchii]GIZ41069.1 hypothetical protein CKM354_000438500 [Cercospora kikuchii]
MEAAGAAVGLIAHAIKLGRELIELYRTVTDAQDEIAERALYVRAQWTRMEVQLEFIERIWRSLREDHRVLQREILSVLTVKLESAKSRLSGLMKKPTGSDQVDNQHPAVKRWKYMFVKPYLDETITSLDRWQQMYDPSWWLVLRIAGPLVDAELSRQDARRASRETTVISTAKQVRATLQGGAALGTNLTLSSAGPANSRSSSIPYSSARYMERPGKAGLIVDSIHCLHGAYVGDMNSDVRTLAAKLQSADSLTFGVLRCRGFTKVKSSNGARLESFNLVLETKTIDPPRTLRSCLIAQTTHTLTERIGLAKQLARSINYVHTMDFVHKNVRPDNLLGFGDAKLGPFFLVGFEQIRSADGMTYFRGDADWEKNLYRHPERQGFNPGERYCMQHDIYSLGVCLLEIGLWESFVLYPEGEKKPYPNTKLLGLSVQALQKKTPNGIKRLLVELATRELPGRIGELYRDVVLNCLTCLDEDNMDFGEESEFDDDADGVAVGVRYIEKVLLKLDSINM